MDSTATAVDEAGSFDALLSKLGTDERIRGRQFELIVKWLLENSSEYKSLLDRVWLWNEWPDRDGGDIGIDLVARALDGSLWAIQAKCRHPDSALPKKEVDSFLAASGQRFSFRLLIATNRRLGPNAERALSDAGAGWRLYDDLCSEAIAWPSHPDVLLPARAQRATPMLHQSEALAAVMDGLHSEGSRGQLIMPCGTGKTLVGLWTAEMLNARTVLVLTPSLSLLGQTMSEWTVHSADQLHVLAVCSDRSVTGEDAMVSSTGELGIPVTTDPAAVASFLGGSSNRRVIFGTYQSLRAIATGVQAAGHKLDLVIADEAHRTTGGGDFSLVTDDSELPARRRLFMTATPRYWTNRRRAAATEMIVASMDEAALFGVELHRLTFGEAVTRKLLADYRVVVVGVDAATLESIYSTGLVQRAGAEPEHLLTLAQHAGLARAVSKYNLRRVITYHSRVRDSQKFAADFEDTWRWMQEHGRASGDLRASHVSGVMAAGLRRVRLNELRRLTLSERSLVANAKCLCEGVDVPALDGIAFMAPRSSPVEVVQAVGRVMRRSEGKGTGTVVVPVLVEDTDDPDATLSASGFRTVWQILRALRAHDETLAFELDLLRRQQGEGKAGEQRHEIPDRVLLDMPATIDITFVDRLRVRLVEETTSRWEQWYGHLLRYVADHGDARIPQSCSDARYGGNIGAWVNGQRDLRRSGGLSQDRVQALESLPGWAWNLNDQYFEDQLSRLREHVADHGFSKMGLRENRSLARWVNGVRTAYRRNQISTKRIAALESVSGWTWDTYQPKWDFGYRALLDFYNQHGHSRVPDASMLPNGSTLSRWIVSQKMSYKLGRMPADRIEKLNRIGDWAWPEGPYKVNEEIWEKRFESLRQFVVDNGHAEPAQKVSYNGVQLGNWVSLQRQLYRRGILPPHFAERLQALDGWLWSHENIRWNKSFEQLRAFAESRDELFPLGISATSDGFRIALWVDKQRAAYRNSQLSEEQVRALEAIRGWKWSGPVR